MPNFNCPKFRIKGLTKGNRFLIVRTNNRIKKFKKIIDMVISRKRMFIFRRGLFLKINNRKSSNLDRILSQTFSIKK